MRCLKIIFSKIVVPRNLSIVVLSVLSVLCLLICKLDGGIKIGDLCLNLCAGFIASIATITIIDRLFKKQKEKDELPLRKVAYREVQSFTSGFIRLWSEMYAQSIPMDNDIYIDNLFSQNSIEIVRQTLDLEGCTSTDEKFFSYIPEHTKELIAAGNKILDRYFTLIDPDTIYAIFYMINDGVLLAHLKYIAQIRTFDTQKKFPRNTVLNSYLLPVNDHEIERIKTLLNWCRINYSKLKDQGNFYAIPGKVEIINSHIKLKAVMTGEKLQRQESAMRQWQEQHKNGF